MDEVIVSTATKMQSQNVSEKWSTKVSKVLNEKTATTS
jgi:hypothetical protein